MENPMTWNRATYVISNALAEADRQRRTSIIGHSPARIIHDALEKEGLLRVEEQDGEHDFTDEDMDRVERETAPLLREGLIQKIAALENQLKRRANGF